MDSQHCPPVIPASKRDQHNVNLQEHAHTTEEDHETAKVGKTTASKDGSTLVAFAITSWVGVVQLIVRLSEGR